MTRPKLGSKRIDFKISASWFETLRTEAQSLGYVNSWGNIAWGQFFGAIASQIKDGKLIVPNSKIMRKP